MRVTRYCPAHHLQGFQDSQQTAGGQCDRNSDIISGNRLTPLRDGQRRLCVCPSQLQRDKRNTWSDALIEIDSKVVWELMRSNRCRVDFWFDEPLCQACLVLVSNQGYHEAYKKPLRLCVFWLGCCVNLPTPAPLHSS